MTASIPAKYRAVDEPVADNNIRDSDRSVWLLYRGVKSILKCDSADVVNGIARYVVSQRRGLRLLSALIEQTRGSFLPILVALIGGLRSFLEVDTQLGSVGDKRTAVWIARLRNERRAIEMLPGLVPSLNWVELKFKWHSDLSTVLALVRNLRSSLRRLIRIARLLERRYQFFQVLRVIELIAYYSRFVDVFGKRRIKLAVTSNHSNPHGIAFAIAAQKARVPTVLISHGMPVRPVARLSYDLAVVHCLVAQQTYVAQGCHADEFIVHGRRQDYAPMTFAALPQRLTIGIFLCKDVNEQRLRCLIERLLTYARVDHIVIRSHPTNLWAGIDSWILSLNDQRVSQSSAPCTLSEIQASDIVLGGNSSVLVEAVTAGRPSAYVRGLDYGSDDLHLFVASGLTYPIEDDCVFDPDSIFQFYQRPGWPTILRTFANIKEDETAVMTRVASAISRLSQR